MPYDRQQRRRTMPMGMRQALEALVSAMERRLIDPASVPELVQAKRVLQYRRVQKPWQIGGDRPQA